MAVRYKTVLEEAEEMIVIEKSRFIGYIKPVETVEEAEAFVASIRTANRDATHNVPVYVLGEKYLGLSSLFTSILSFLSLAVMTTCEWAKMESQRHSEKELTMAMKKRHREQTKAKIFGKR